VSDVLFVCITMELSHVTNCLSICSYNMHGFNQGVNYLIENIGQFDVWCLQEHWLYPSTISKFNNISNLYEYNVICDVTDEDVIKSGRPKGGLAFMWRKSLSASIKFIGSSFNNRVMAVRIVCKEFDICLCNVYLPCFEQTDEYSVILMECISYVDHVYESLRNEQNCIELCVVGDCNVDLNKIVNNHYVSGIRDLMADYDLILATESVANDGGYTYCNETSEIYSMIDHCLVSRNLHDKCASVCIIDSVDNFSDHLPVCVKFNVNLYQHVLDEIVRFRAKWDSESVNEYYNRTRDAFYALGDVYVCDTVVCGDSAHNKCIDEYCNEIVRVLHDCTVWSCIQNNNSGGEKMVWSRVLNDAKMTARTMRRIWLQAGKPKSGVVFDNMVRARRAYKIEVKKAKKAAKDKRSDHIDSLLRDNDYKFWQKWKRVNSRDKPRLYDGTLANGLLQNFNSKYTNSMSNVNLLNDFLMKYELSAGSCGSDNVAAVSECSVEFIEKCAQELHLKRACDINALTVEHIVYAHPIVYSHLKQLFDLIVRHGHVPADFKIGVISPVVKDARKDVSSVDNYRPVTIISVISKLFEMCVYKMIGGYLNVGGLQYGFVKGGGCDKSIFTVQNTVNYFLRRKSNVYMVTLDASAAFDRVNTYALLSKLLDRGVPYGIVRVLFSWYNVSHACVRMNGHCTDMIDIRSGVKQGGIMSPQLYNVYVDELMSRLLRAKLGCMIGDFVYSAVFYADDIVLLSSSRRKMQRMIDICYEYGLQYGITFNAKKSKWFFAGDGGNGEGVSFKLGDCFVVHECNTLSYLGVKFKIVRHLLVIDVDDRIRKFNCSAYSVLLNSSDLSEVVRCEIIVKKCLPILTYGLGCGYMWPADIYKLHIAYRKIFRYIFKLPLICHVTEFLNVFGIESVESVLYRLKCKFVYTSVVVFLK
jgi:exonuclease III